MKWPDGFMWGTGASSTQCEGAAPASNWIDWERAGRAPTSGEGNGFARRYRQDFGLLAQLGLTHHRLSVEWARIEPEPGRRDPGAVEHYRSVLAAARDAGLSPWVCLHHFTLPRWFAESGGFLIEENRTGAWRSHVDFMAETFGNEVFGWQPVNETNYYAQGAYRGGGWPPGINDRDTAAVAAEAIHLATAEAAVRLRQTGRPVSSIYGLSPTVTHDQEPDSERLAARAFEVHWASWLGLVRDGRLHIRGRAPVERPDLAGCFDLIGFSYYSTMGVAHGRLVPHPDGAPVSPLGYGIWADGVGLVIERLNQELPGTPLLVAEYGIGTDDDDQRADYLRRGLEVVNHAIAGGADVRGLFHWTAVDNYEWMHGYDVAFGLIDANRKVRASAEVIAAEARRAG
jgi:beta-glucosidase